MILLYPPSAAMLVSFMSAPNALLILFPRLFEDAQLGRGERAAALKFLIPFLREITQPLYCENLAEGGNDIGVRFNDASTNLTRSGIAQVCYLLLRFPPHC